jgi:branched chain amino acid efflux pump
MTTLESIVTILGLAAITVLTRCFFLLSDRDIKMPGWAQRGLRYAPLAALSAVVVPEVLITNGHFITTWQDARIYAVVAASAYFFWRRGILGTIVSGMAVLLPLKLGLGW